MKIRRWAQLCPSVYCDSPRIPQDNKSVITVCVPSQGLLQPAPVVWTTTLFVLLRHRTLGSGDTRGTRGLGTWWRETDSISRRQMTDTATWAGEEGCLKMMPRCHSVCKTGGLTWPLWQFINKIHVTWVYHCTCHELCVLTLLLLLLASLHHYTMPI